MPVVSTKKFRVPLTNGEAEDKALPLHFDSVLGFYVKLEEDWIRYLSDKEFEDLGVRDWNRHGYKGRVLVASEFEKLTKSLENLLELARVKWRDGKREKVLMITFDAVAVKERRSKGEAWDWEREATRTMHEHRWGGEEKTSIEFDYEVAYRCGESLYNEDMRRLHEYGMDEKIIIPWTEARQIFLSGVLNAFGALIRRVDDFLKATGKEPALLDAVIERGMKLLPPARLVRKETLRPKAPANRPPRPEAPE